MSVTLGDDIGWPAAIISVSAAAILEIIRRWSWGRKAKAEGDKHIAELLFQQQSTLWTERSNEVSTLRHRIEHIEEIAEGRLNQIQDLKDRQTALNRRIDEVSAINEILAAQVARLQRRVSSLERQLRDLGHEPEPEQK